MLKIKLFNGKTITDSSDVGVDSKKNGNNNKGNNNSEKFRRKSIKSKSRNLTSFKKITRNNIIKIRLRFLIFVIKKAFN